MKHLNGPIIVIEDDEDDRQLLEEVFQDLKYPNDVLYFADGYKALAYIESTEANPFIILSDINLPKINGLELKRKIHNNDELKIRCIPYLFFTTGVNRKAVYDAYSMSAQGFFIKPESFDVLRDTIKIIIEYWKRCYSPNHYAD